MNCRACRDGIVIYRKLVNGRTLEFAAACVCEKGRKHTYMPCITEVMPKDKAS